jgi:hypothetical protein
MLKGSCPSCGGEMTFVSKVSLYAVCPWCSSLVMRKDLALEKIGVVGELQEDGTPIRLGTAGLYQGRPFDVIGRIQLRFPAGYWNEWYLRYGPDRDGWLGETQGIYAVTFKAKVLEAVPSFTAMRPGLKVVLNGEAFEVKDIQDAKCIGGEGELPFEIESGYEAPVVDLGTGGPRCATIDYSETPPLVFVGEYQEFDRLQLRNLRELEGW